MTPTMGCGIAASHFGPAGTNCGMDFCLLVVQGCPMAGFYARFAPPCFTLHPRYPFLRPRKDVTEIVCLSSSGVTRDGCWEKNSRDEKTDSCLLAGRVDCNSVWPNAGLAAGSSIWKTRCCPHQYGQGAAARQARVGQTDPGRLLHQLHGTRRAGSDG